MSPITETCPCGAAFTDPSITLIHIQKWRDAHAPCRTETWRDRTEANQHLSAEQVARAFHETYERLAPGFGYTTREASAVPWDDVPEDNRRLMVAVAYDLLIRDVIA